MNWFLNLNISKKLLISFLAISAFAIVIGAIGIINMNKMDEASKVLYYDITVPTQQLGSMSIYFQRQRINLRDMIMAEEKSEIKKFSNTVAALKDSIDQTGNRFKELLLTEAGQKMYADFEESKIRYYSYLDEMTALAFENKDVEARQLMLGAAFEVSQKTQKYIDDLYDAKLKLGIELANGNEELAENSFSTMAAALLIGLLLAVALGIFISRFISKGIQTIVNAVESLRENGIVNLENGALLLSEGSLEGRIFVEAKPIDFNYNDEVGRLANSVNEIIKNTKSTSNSLEKAVSVVRELIDETAVIVESSASGDLSKRGNAEKFNGGYKEVIVGLNRTLESFSAPLTESKVVLEKMAEGDLTVRMIGDYRGDLKQIKDSVNTFADSMSYAIGEVIIAAQSTATASEQITSSSEEMAAGAQEQSHQTAEVAGAIEEMTKTILENSNNASKASDNSKLSSDKAKLGMEKVQKTKEGMQRIVSSAKETGKIISSLASRTNQIGEITQVIDDIADQTNLLALNAAIEAARAGEQGRGFAVVADEVRKLAERTTKATKEIDATIKAIQGEASQANDSMKEADDAVTDGMAISEEVTYSLSEILAEVEQVSQMIFQVAAASEQQSAASEQISKNIEGINNVTQQSAVGVEQIANAAENLNNLTFNLQKMVERFKVQNFSEENIAA